MKNEKGVKMENGKGKMKNEDPLNLCKSVQSVDKKWRSHISEFTTIRPVFGENYDIGYVGFEFPSFPGAFSRGITYFTRWDCMSDIPVSHTFLVTGPDECIEARFRGGVQVNTLKHYFDGPYRVFFRKPVLYSQLTGQMLADTARREIGKRYDKKLIIAHAILGSLAFRIMNKARWGFSGETLAQMLDTPDAFICSELVAHVMGRFTEYCNRGCLRWPSARITPQQLFEDAELFEPWKNQNEATKENDHG